LRGQHAQFQRHVPVTDCFPKRGDQPASNKPDPALPAPDTKRWVARRKAVVVEAVRSGVVSLEEVCLRYNISVEEFHAWESAIQRHGVPGLRVTRLQIYRDTDAGVPKGRRRYGHGIARNRRR
jgi:hypothetical protein